MAAAVATDTITGTRRAVVRSERFMEWQRELSSSRATYGGRKRCEDAEGVEINAGKKLPERRQVNEDNAAKPHEGSEERGGEADGLVEGQKTKLKQQRQRQRSCSKSLQKERDNESRKVAVREGKDSADPIEAESSHLCRCKQQGSQVGHLREKQELQSLQVQQRMRFKQTVNSRRQRQMPMPSLERERGQQKNRLKRTRGQKHVLLPDLPTRIGTKRSRRVALRSVHEEPVSPPLKLPKLQLLLTRKEIQEDWMKITGHRYSGKPKKSTLVQRGLGLCTSLTCPSSIRYLSDP